MFFKVIIALLVIFSIKAFAAEPVEFSGQDTNSKLSSKQLEVIKSSIEASSKAKETASKTKKAVTASVSS